MSLPVGRAGNNRSLTNFREVARHTRPPRPHGYAEFLSDYELPEGYAQLFFWKPLPSQYPPPQEGHQYSSLQILPESLHKFLMKNRIPDYMHKRDFRQAQGDVPGRLEREMVRVMKSHEAEQDKKFNYQLTESAPTDLEQHGDIDGSLKQVGPCSVGIYAAKGGVRETMEDTHLASTFSFTVGGREYPVQLFGVFDGHGGAQTAQLLKASFQKELQNQLLTYNRAGLSEEGIFNALKFTFVELQRTHEGDFGDSGSTATIAIILDGKVWTANVGDSRTVLDNNGTPIALSRDAKPGRSQGKMTGDSKDPSTIKANGGFYGSIVKRSGSASDGCVWGVNGLGQITGVGMARSVGDISTTAGNACRPKITVKSLADISKNSHLILCCDGVWDVCSTKQVVEAVHAHRSRSPLQLAQDIAHSAYRSGSADNLSVIVVRLPDDQPLEIYVPPYIPPSSYMHWRDFREARGDVPKRLEAEMGRVRESQKAEQNKQFLVPFDYQPINGSAPTELEQLGDIDFSSENRRSYSGVGCYSVGIYTAKGVRETMEDAHLASEFLLTIGKRQYPVQLFGVFDGHVNAKTAQLLKSLFQEKLQNQLLKYNWAGLSDEGIFNALKFTFVEFQKAHANDFEGSGSTATVAIILNGKLWTANVGDSRTVLDNNGTPIALSRDAKPGDGQDLAAGQYLQDEKGQYRMGWSNTPLVDTSSVKANGGFYGSVIKRGGYVEDQKIRVLELGWLSMARTVGDTRFTGTTCRPKITAISLADVQNNSHLVLGCDGLWDTCSTKRLVEVVHNHRSRSPLQLARDIANAAYRSGSTDNISVLIVRLFA